MLSAGPQCSGYRSQWHITAIVYEQMWGYNVTLPSPTALDHRDRRVVRVPLEWHRWSCVSSFETAGRVRCDPDEHVVVDL